MSPFGTSPTCCHVRDEVGFQGLSGQAADSATRTLTIRCGLSWEVL